MEAKVKFKLGGVEAKKLFATHLAMAGEGAGNGESKGFMRHAITRAMEAGRKPGRMPGVDAPSPVRKVAFKRMRPDVGTGPRAPHVRKVR